MTTTIYLARHAEAHNPQGILYGRLPRVELSERGRQQAAALGDALAGLPLQAVYSSPLLRARRTAAAIARHHPRLMVRHSRLLLENQHPYQGRTHADVAKLGDRVYDADVLGETGETIGDLRDRLVRFLQRVQRECPGGIVAAVGHADPIAALRSHLLAKPLVPASLREEAPVPASVFRVELWGDGSTRLEWHWKPETVAAEPASAQQPAPAAE